LRTLLAFVILFITFALLMGWIFGRLHTLGVV